MRSFWLRASLVLVLSEAVLVLVLDVSLILRLRGTQPLIAGVAVQTRKFLGKHERSRDVPDREAINV